MENTLIPTKITLHQQSNNLELAYDDQHYHLPAEYLRVYSPSAEVRGHGRGQEVLQTNKENIHITQLEAVGHYALKIYFDDGHNTGLFTWDYLYSLATEQNERWEDYLASLKQAGYQRNK